MGEGRGLKEDGGTWLGLQSEEGSSRPPPTNDLSGELGQNDEDPDDSSFLVNPQNVKDLIISSAQRNSKSKIRNPISSVWRVCRC